MATELRSVSWLNQFVAARLGDDPVLSDLAIIGEISGGKLYPSGHFYFTLKDQHAQVSCVFFSMARKNLDFKPENGMKVICYGRACLYQKNGRFQLNVVGLEQEGVGDLHKRLLDTKDRLQREGLFRTEHKQSLPFWPARIGVVTSIAGAVLSDILFVLRQHAPSFDLLLYPVAVQGSEAARQIAAAINQANRDRRVDVLIVGRGGGSFEDLYAFNEEMVVRAIYESSIPIVSAVGHETDVTLADYAADVRMPTPTAAAAKVMPSKDDLIGRLQQVERSIISVFAATLAKKKQALKAWQKQETARHPVRLLEARRQTIDLLAGRRDRAIRQAHGRLVTIHRANMAKMKQAIKAVSMGHAYGLESIKGRLQTLNPKAILKRGYAYVTTEGDSIVASMDLLAVGDRLQVHFYDGQAEVEVMSLTQPTKSAQEDKTAGCNQPTEKTHEQDPTV